MLVHSRPPVWLDQEYVVRVAPAGFHARRTEGHRRYCQAARLDARRHQALDFAGRNVAFDSVPRYLRRMARTKCAWYPEFLAVIRRIGHIVDLDRETVLFQVLRPRLAATARLNLCVWPLTFPSWDA